MVCSQWSLGSRAMRRFTGERSNGNDVLLFYKLCEA